MLLEGPVLRGGAAKVSELGGEAWLGLGLSRVAVGVGVRVWVWVWVWVGVGVLGLEC